MSVGTSKGSTISHMAAVHLGHYLSGDLQKEEEEEEEVICLLGKSAREFLCPDVRMGRMVCLITLTWKQQQISAAQISVDRTKECFASKLHVPVL